MFNLSVKGHGECVRYIKTWGIPTILSGGGGYTLRNVPRCWTYETSVAIGQDIKNEMPLHKYRDYFCPDYKIHLPVSNIENQNPMSKIELLNKKIIENLKQVNVTNGELSHYVNGGAHPPNHLNLDFKEIQDIKDEKNIDKSTDKKDN